MGQRAAAPARLSTPLVPFSCDIRRMCVDILAKRQQVRPGTRERDEPVAAPPPAEALARPEPRVCSPGRPFTQTPRRRPATTGQSRRNPDRSLGYPLKILRNPRLRIAVRRQGNGGLLSPCARCRLRAGPVSAPVRCRSDTAGCVACGGVRCGVIGAQLAAWLASGRGVPARLRAGRP
jgi:hypothetical protein